MRNNGRQNTTDTLNKELGLWDVYCIATGAMFSSGFFLLPGLATASAGPSAVVAYLIAGGLMLPSMLSMLELSTALPRAGGAYYFLDRSLGPGVGTITGIGTWLSLVLKSAFSLVGMGAYLAVLPLLSEYLLPGSAGSVWGVKLLALSFTGIFVGVNIFGAHQSARIQKVLVVGMLGVLAIFLGQGLWHVAVRMPTDALAKQYTPFLHPENGWAGLFSTVGLVFVSYAGLTKVASISEEVRKPERNLPWAMVLSLTTATVVYVAGVFIMVAVLAPDELREDYTPVLTAARVFAGWFPEPVLPILIIVAALAAFASTGNAGILSASRYPLAMARDRLVPPALEKVGRFGTPTRGILLTGGLMAVFILAFSPEGVAKLGSTFNLLVFGLVNIAVIVMRESRIDSYDPAFRVPFYPWLPLAGAGISGFLIFEMGWVSIAFSAGTVAAATLWYLRYARARVERYGAIHHAFARWGEHRDRELQTEFREIIKEKGLRDEDPFDEIVERAAVVDVPAGGAFDAVMHEIADGLARRIPMSPRRIARRLIETGRYGGASITHGAALLHFRSSKLERSEMVLVRAREGLCISLPTDDESPDPAETSCEVHAVFVLVSPESKTGQHLRILAELADRAEDESFMRTWRDLQTPNKLKETLLRDARFLELFAGADAATKPLIGKTVGRLDLPSGSFVAMVRRKGEGFEPVSDTVIEHGDHLTLIGEPEAIETLYERYVRSGKDGQ